MDVLLAGLVVPHVQNHSLEALTRAARAHGFSAATTSFAGFRDLRNVADEVLASAPRVFGLSLQTAETALASAALLQIVRRRGYCGLIVVGGHFATTNAHGILRELPAVDAVVRFAGEAALVALLQRGLSVAIDDVPGLLLRGADGEIRCGAVPELGLIPRPSFRYERAQDEAPSPVHLGFGAADLVLSRGCEAHCSYCCVAGISDLAERHGRRSETMAVDAIVEQIAALHHKRGTRVFNFMDDNLLPLEPVAARAFIAALSEGLGRAKVGRLAFSLQLRADVCAPAVVEALAELGLVRAYVGIDGYSARHLVALGRAAPAQAGPEALSALEAAGVYTVCNALLIGPTFTLPTILKEIEALSHVRHAPLHLLPVDVRAGSAYFERVRQRGLLEGGTFCRRYRFADPRTALLAEVLTGLPTRLEEYSVPVALYDLAYNLGIARRLRPEVELAGPAASYQEIVARWNVDQIRVLRAAAEVAADGRPALVRELLAIEQPRVRALDDELRLMCADALRAVERAVSQDLGRPVKAHARGKLISALTFSAALAACTESRPTVIAPDADADADAADVDAPAISWDAPRDDGRRDPCADGGSPLAPDGGLRSFIECGELRAEVTFDERGVAKAVTLVDGGVPAGSDAGTSSAEAVSCVTNLLAAYCYPSLANTTQTLISHHFWIA